MGAADRYKRLLIISPHFPPTNAADMQRVRMSLPYFQEFDWEVEVVVVDDQYVDLDRDNLLLESIPSNIIIHKVEAFSKKWTAKIGLGSIGLRSMYFYRKKVDKLLAERKYDLIYFSTTQFPVCILGAHWKKKFDIPFVIDMQDPWHSEYYKNKPKSERPKKYWFSYRLHKYLEPIAMNEVDGLISVSANYILTLRERYPLLKNKPAKLITFGAFDRDFKIAKVHDKELPLAYKNEGDRINIVYIGRGGYDMRDSVKLLFECFKKGLENENALFQKVRFHFIGTSYAPKGKGMQTIRPNAEEIGISEYVEETTDRIGFYASLKNLDSADGLFIMGSNDVAYTASKLYPYILANKPLLSIFHRESNACEMLRNINGGDLITIDESLESAYETVKSYLNKIVNKVPTTTKWQAFEKYGAHALTKEQVHLFDEIIQIAKNKTL